MADNIKKTSRRELLLGSASLLGTSYFAAQLPPIRKLIDVILADVIRTAGANGQTVTSKYIYMPFPGAPPRWVFDQFLKLSPTDTINPSIMASTIYTSSGGSYQGAAYQTIDYKGMPVPPLWGTQVYTASGGKRMLSDLLDCMITFRGYGTGVDGHTANAAKQTNPISSIGSVSGHMADHSATLFKAIQFPNAGGFSGYNSIIGTGLTALAYTGRQDYATQVLAAFGSRGETAALNALRGRYSDYISDAQNILRGLASVDHPDFQPTSDDQRNALVKIKLGVQNIDQVWSGLFNKYLSIAENTFRDRTVPGFTDQPIPVGQDTGANETLWSLQTDFGVLYPTPGQDIRDWANQMDLSLIASTFALAEFVITNDLSSSYEMYLDYIHGLTGSFIRDTNGPFASPVSKTTSFVVDQHQTGIMASLFPTACLFRAVGGCILELIESLKAKNLFSSTVLHLGQDFGRLPRNTGGGSDHGFDGMISSIFTGLQSGGPKVIGNILSEGSNGGAPSGYSGTFGYKAPTMVAGVSTMLSPAHVTSTLAQLLRLPSNPWGNVAHPLIVVDGSSLQYQAEAKLVTS